MNRIYGWSQAGERPMIIRRVRGKRLNMVGAIATDGVRCALQYEGSMNAELFLRFVLEILCPTLRKGETVVLDGVNFHKKLEVREAINAVGANLMILPPYSPEWNPIESAWSTWKARLRRLGAATWESLKETAQQVWENLDLHFFPAWIKNCGYTPST